jgi:hypothetical protein
VRSYAGAHSGPRLLPLLIFSAKRHDLGVFLQPQRRFNRRGPGGSRKHAAVSPRPVENIVRRDLHRSKRNLLDSLYMCLCLGIPQLRYEFLPRQISPYAGQLSDPVVRMRYSQP